MEVILFIALVVLFGVSVSKINSLSSKLQTLEWELKALKGELNALRSALATKIEKTPAPSPEKIVEPAPASLVVEPVKEQETIPVQEQTEPAIQALPLPLPPVYSHYTEKPSRTKEEWEALIGGKLLNRIGALALIIGIGFFLKYTFDNNLISQTARVIIGGIAGVGLLAGAAIFHKKNLHIFAQGLVGAGISVLYLSVYASFNFYHLVSQPVAFGMMSAVTLGTFLQAYRYDSIAVSLLGWAGGFLTPVLLSTGQANEVGLFTYIAILNVGILSIVLLKEEWIVLEPLTLVATYIMYIAWHLDYYKPDAIIQTSFFLTIFWLLFFGIEFWRCVKNISASENIRQIVSAFSLIFYYISLYSIVYPNHHGVMAFVTILLCVVYTGSTAIIRKNGNTSVIPQYTVTAIILLIVATAVQYSGFTTVMLWSIEMAALMLAASRWQMKYVWATALGLLGLTLFKLFSMREAIQMPVDTFSLLFNQRASTLLVLICSTAVSAFFFKSENERTKEMISTGLHSLWSFLFLFLCFIEIEDRFRQIIFFHSTPEEIIRFHKGLTISGTFLLSSAGLVWLGLKRSVQALLFIGVIALTVSVLSALIGGFRFYPIEQFVLFLNIRFALFLFVLLGCSLHIVLIKPHLARIEWLQHVIQSTQIALIVLLFGLFTYETVDFFQHQIALIKISSDGFISRQDIDRLTDIEGMTLSVVWLCYSIALMGAGLWKRWRGLRLISMILFGFTIVKIFIYDLSFLNTLYRITSFIGLGLILLAVSYLYSRYKDVIDGKEKEIVNKE